MNKLNEILWVLVFVVVLLSVAGLAFFFTSGTVSSKYTNLDEFAACVANSGAVMYGASWCPHCLEEKKSFGKSVSLINYVECPDNIALCVEKGIMNYPTWILGDGSKLIGSQGLEKISEATNCKLK